MAVISFNQNANGEHESITIKGNEEEIEKIVDYIKHMYDKPVDNDSDYNSDETDMVSHPLHYCFGRIETINKIEAVIDGLPAKQAAALSNVLKYFDRAGLKDNAEQDLAKANNYAHRLVTGKWRKDS